LFKRSERQKIPPWVNPW